ncbi:MAG: hypothetical protein ACK4TA_16685 [Saprospiraceae bacterium]
MFGIFNRAINMIFSYYKKILAARTLPALENLKILILSLVLFQATGGGLFVQNTEILTLFSTPANLLKVTMLFKTDVGNELSEVRFFNT